jgi:hypothetical protein
MGRRAQGGQGAVEGVRVGGNEAGAGAGASGDRGAGTLAEDLEWIEVAIPGEGKAQGLYTLEVQVSKQGQPLLAEACAQEGSTTELWKACWGSKTTAWNLCTARGVGWGHSRLLAAGAEAHGKPPPSSQLPFLASVLRSTRCLHPLQHVVAATC